MWHRLALALGHNSLADCQASISSLEFTHWLAYYQVEPFGYELDNYRAGVIAAAIVNLLSKSKVKPLDFFEKPKQPSWQDLLTKVVGINAELGGKDLRQSKPSSV